MALPNSLKNFNAFVDGVSYMGTVDEIKLHKLARKMEAYRGGGMDGEIDLDMGQEKMEMEIVCSGFVADAYKRYGTSKANGVLVRFAGAYQRDDTEAVQAVEIVVRGRYSEIDPDSAKGGDKGKHTSKLSLSYYKLIVDNEELVEIDLLAFIFKVDGNDRFEAQRKAIGLA